MIRQALAVPANNATGTLADVEHVVIFMPENRSFDHYFGTLSGVRGFGDPRAIDLPNGKGGHVLRFHFDAENTSTLPLGTDHSWKGSQADWQGWRRRRWVTSIAATCRLEGASGGHRARSRYQHAVERC